MTAAWRLVLFAAALLAGSAATRPANAHAVLVETAPADQAVVAQPPEQILLSFNEAVTPIALRMIGPGATQVSLPATAVDRTVRAALPRDLTAGRYLVSWRVISADAHPIGGAFAFSIGAGAAPPVHVADGGAQREAWWKRAVIVNRALGDVALLFAAGGTLCMVLVFGGVVARPVRVGLTVGAAIAALSAAAAVPLARGWIVAAPLEVLLGPELWTMGPTAALHRRAAACGLGLLLAVAGLHLAHRRAGAVLAVCGALAACAGMALSGHVAARVPSWPAQAALMLHAVTAAFWLGSLWPLWRAVRDAPASTALAYLRRFSAMAVPAVILLVLAGAGVALTRIADAGALVATDYGRVLLFKLAFVVLMAALALRNRRLTNHGAEMRGATELARNIRLEIGAAGAVLLLTAVLGHTAPDSGRRSEDHDHTPAGGTIMVENRGIALHVAIAPAHVGVNRIVARLADSSGRAVVPREVTIELSLPAGQIEKLSRAMKVEQAVFVLDAVDFPLAGLWHLRVDALINDFEKISFVAELELK
jgi:copper transport protein